MTFTITEATFLSSLVTFFLVFLTWRQLRMNGQQIKLEFLGKSYEDILTLIDATTTSIEKWIGALGAETASFLPSESVSLKEAVALKAASNQVNIKLELYPNENVNPVVFEWMEVLLQFMNDFASLYALPNSGGVMTVSIQTRDDTVAKLKRGFVSLKAKRQQVVAVMVKELQIPK